MTREPKREYYDGLLWGTITTQYTVRTGPPVMILTPFEVKIALSGVGTSLQGTYELSATPQILSPIAPLPYPGPLDICPPGSYPPVMPRLDGSPSPMVLAASFIVNPVNHNGSVKVEVKGNRMSIELIGVPESTYFTCTTIVDRSSLMGGNYLGAFLPVVAAGEIDLGFFSRKSAIYKPEFELDFNSKRIAYVGRYNLKKERRNQYPVGGFDVGNAEFVVIKNESFYTVIDDGGPRYVEQTGLEEARRLFLENPELLTMMQTEAKRQIRHGVSDEHVSRGLVESVLPPEAGDESWSPSETGQTSGSGLESPKLDEVFLEALRILVQFGGSSNHAMVVSCGWAKFLRIEKGKKLQLDVAGSMYLQSGCKLNESHIQTLKEMGLLLDSHSVEIYTTKFDATSEEELAKAARLIEPIFSRVYRRKKGEEAYLEMVLGTKTPEAEAALNTLATRFLHRDGFKFRFRW